MDERLVKERNRAEVILSVEGISKTYRKKWILDNVSFEVKRGEVVGLVGPNGSGKSTTIKIICGLVFPDRGDVRINGVGVFTNPLVALKRVGALVEGAQFYPYLTAFENLELICSISGLDTSRIDRLLNSVGLSEAIHVKVKEFSQGMRQRLGIAQALLKEPELVILDEPTSFLDHNGMELLFGIIRELKDSSKTAFLISGNDLSGMSKICNRIIALNKGKIVADGFLGNLSEEGVSSLEKLF